MYILASKFRYLELRLLLSRVAPYYSSFTTNCLNSKIYLEQWFLKRFLMTRGPGIIQGVLKN